MSRVKIYGWNALDYYFKKNKRRFACKSLTQFKNYVLQKGIPLAEEKYAAQIEAYDKYFKEEIEKEITLDILNILKLPCVYGGKCIRIEEVPETDIGRISELSEALGLSQMDGYTLCILCFIEKDLKAPSITKAHCSRWIAKFDAFLTLRGKIIPLLIEFDRNE